MARTKNYIREDVLNLATQVFLAKGYESTSFADLMAATGLNKKSLYNEFGNKEALFLLVLEGFIADSRQCIRPLVNELPYGISNIQQFFRHLYQRFENTGCLLTLSLNEASCIPDEALALINQTMLNLERGFYQNLNCYPQLTPNQAHMLARNILALMQGYTSLTRSPELRAGNLQAIDDLLSWIGSVITDGDATAQD